MRVDRLLKLADFLDTVPARHFYMDTWGADRADLLRPQNNFRNCGTRACAMGWALAMPEFNREGLSWKYFDRQMYLASLNGDTRGDIIEIGARFFDIPLHDARRLFLNTATDGHSTTAKEEAAFIRKYVASKPQCVEAFYAAQRDQDAASAD